MTDSNISNVDSNPRNNIPIAYISNNSQDANNNIQGTATNIITSNSSNNVSNPNTPTLTNKETSQIFVPDIEIFPELNLPGNTGKTNNTNNYNNNVVTSVHKPEIKKEQNNTNNNSNANSTSTPSLWSKFTDKTMNVLNTVAHPIKATQEVAQNFIDGSAIANEAINTVSKHLVAGRGVPENVIVPISDAASIAITNKPIPEGKSLISIVDDRIENIEKKVDDKLDRIEKMVEPFSKLADSFNKTVIIVNNIADEMGIGGAPSEAKPKVDQPNVKPQEVVEEKKDLPPQSVPNSNIIDEKEIVIEDEEVNVVEEETKSDKPDSVSKEKSDGSTTLGKITERVKGYLGEMLSETISVVPRKLIDQSIRMMIYGLSVAKKNITQADKSLFDKLIADLQALLANDKEMSFEKIRGVLKSINNFSKSIESNRTRITIDGIPINDIPILAFLFESEADFMATPTYDLIVAKKQIEKQRYPEKGSNGDVTMSQFKQDIAKYIGARFAYEIIGGLKPKDGFYNDLFAKGDQDEHLQTTLFRALDRAQRAGKISTIRMWLTKILYYLIQPACSLFIEPFIDKIEHQLEPLQTKKRVAEESTKLLVEQFTKFLSAEVNAFEQVAKGKGDLGEDIDGAMMEELKKKKYNKGESIQQRHRKVIETVVDDLAPGFIFSTRFFEWVQGWGFDKKSVCCLLNPLVSLLKILPYVFNFVVLYPSQLIMNWGMRWGIKKVMNKADILDGIVDKAALTISNDLNMERARLKGTHDFYVNMLDKLKNTKAEDNSPLQEKKGQKGMLQRMQEAKAQNNKGKAIAGEERQISTMVSNLFLVMEYGSQKTIADLSKKIKEKRELPQNAFTFLGIKLDIGDYLNQKTHKRVVEQISYAYRQAIDENLIAQQVNTVKEMMNNMFNPDNQVKPDQLRAEVEALQKENDVLLSELISYAVGRAVEEQFDMSGQQQIDTLTKNIEALKAELQTYVKTQKTLFVQLAKLNKNNKNDKIKTIEKLQDNAANLSTRAMNFFNQLDTPDLKKSYQEFAQKQRAYMTSLIELYKEPNTSLKKAKNALRVIENWEKTIQVPTTVNISLFEDKVKMGIDFAKTVILAHTKQQVESFIDLISKPYNVGGLVNMGLTMYGNRRFPFQK